MGKQSEPAQTPHSTIMDILKGSDYALTIFSDAEIKALKVIDKGGKPYLKCWATDKERPAKPEEIVRQLYIKKLMDHYGYTKERLRIEKEVYFGSAVHEKRADIVVVEKDTLDTPYIIVECKKAKPHTGTKTSVLFIQTWNDDKKAGPLNPQQDDYPVFLATSTMGGKDNGGDYIYRIGPDNAPMLDSHNHMIVEHDLDEIASEFVKWGKAQGLSFCEGAE